MNIRTVLTTSAAIGVLALAGCSGSGTTATPESTSASSSPSESAAVFNDADVSFAQNMAMHHQQAIEMSDLLLAKDGVDERVTALAEQIKAAQQPEIEQMNAWLEAWGADTDSSGGLDHGDMGHGEGGGMMSEEDMAALEAATGAEASSLFLQQMIEHHTGAIDMAQQETDEGQNPEAIALAERIVTDQQAEIDQMQALLESL